jgi:hypothetical protein
MFSFLITYLDGVEFFIECLKSIRRHHPTHPILVAKGGDTAEMMLYDQYDITWFEAPGSHLDAMVQLREMCPTDIGLFIDADTVVMRNLDYLAEKIKSGETELIGMEEVIKSAVGGGYMRYSPGFMPMTFQMFDLRSFKENHDNDWVWNGVYYDPNSVNHEGYWGLSQKLKKKYFLLPYNTRYGLGTLQKDEEGNDVFYHQWYGSWRRRHLSPESDGGLYEEGRDAYNYLAEAEDRFLSDWRGGKADFTNITLAK